MNEARQPSNPSTPLRFVLLLIGWLLALVIAGCGGGQVDPRATEADSVDDTGDGDGGVTASTDNAELQVGDSDRPDWLPPWVLLPEGLEITLALEDDGTGESAITGFLTSGDAQELYDQAIFMVQSGGYLIGEESQTSGLGFNADHTSDDSSVRFAVIESDPETVQWSLEFSRPDSAGDAGDATAVDDASSAPTGTAVLTITVAGETWSTQGSCDRAMGDFEADDGYSIFSVIEGDPDFGAGNVGRSVDGELVDSWFAGPGMGVVSAEIFAGGLSFEGDMSLGSRTEVAVIEVDCG